MSFPHHLAIGMLGLTCVACDGAAPAVSYDGESEEVANEARIELAPETLQNLQQQALAGDLSAAQQLANYYAINFGDDHSDTVRWQLHGARLGDCELWEDLIFMEQHEQRPVPPDLFSENESLESIGTAKGCVSQTFTP